MQCLKCQRENPTEALFCIRCGTKLERKCPHCGADYPEEALFCMKCGTKLKEVTTPTLSQKMTNLADSLEQGNEKLQKFNLLGKFWKWLTK